MMNDNVVAVTARVAVVWLLERRAFPARTKPETRRSVRTIFIVTVLKKFSLFVMPRRGVLEVYLDGLCNGTLGTELHGCNLAPS